MLEHNSARCYLNQSDGKFETFYRMHELDEVLGKLQNIDQNPQGLIAIIENIPVLLPQEFEEKLKGKEGQTIAILKCEGYRFRDL